jgi:hypothetical protein
LPGLASVGCMLSCKWRVQWQNPLLLDPFCFLLVQLPV